MSVQDEAEYAYECYVKAGKIWQKVMERAVPMVRKGAKLLDVANFVEEYIAELGGRPAFPCNISLNEEAAHNTPSADDELVFGEDIVKLDVGVHVDGYIADGAITIDLLGHPELKRASEDALRAAIEVVEAGVSTAEVGAAIESTILDAGFRPVHNLTGHGLERYIAHAPPTIPNKNTKRGVPLEAGMVIAIEPFATTGVGKVADGDRVEIFHTVSSRRARHPTARALQREIEQYHTLPYAKRWLKTERMEYGLLTLLKEGIVKGYPVLKEVSGGLVSQSEHTLIVMDGGCELTTGR
ncbi:type II methionyl aminopeptidase [Methermicoccus shengliensis]|uniref:Methionine aminopeptidase n=1 Tax=Methermicoccus shengliensis TaxID=660064 RepID=A0A832RWU6_9EURY|nr:type II methionyl aminopeptidase [Methermicoccus shengliensis]KUK29484.1 MAG: Methionine aminopeptidase [Methanosarcinales archeaon 56_1174]MDI3488630.1 methionyl aminopeptidase [Methanosarcinales archaeon]MDN5295406.1 methionyl aminopeptidase [Methanosarcinales archaeon]HIH69507.1 type II methionyl aminopeptidase [Methermicoccus shengliensis]